MSDDVIKKIRLIGSDLVDKADKLQELGRIIPEECRKLRAFGEYFHYVAGEYDQLSQRVEFSLCDLPDLGEVERTLNWDVPTRAQVTMTTTTASGSQVQITEPMLSYAHEMPELNLLANPPESFKLLTATDELVETLNGIKNSLGNTWKDAWDSLTMGDLKSAATNARTAVDEISWKVPQDDLAKLPWCKYDDKGKPTRASKFAWILHGEDLPEELNNEPAQDPVWKILSQNYEKLNKYVHISTIQQAETTYLKTILNAIQECLDRYLHQGTKGLK